jgi:hypothetical protein
MVGIGGDLFGVPAFRPAPGGLGSPFLKAIRIYFLVKGHVIHS